MSTSPTPSRTNRFGALLQGTGFVDRRDINECTEFPGICENGRCKNTPGGFSCRCNQGYSLDENGVKCLGEAA